MPSDNPENRPPILCQSPPEQVAIYRPLHVERHVTIYPIQEHELESLEDTNKNSAVWASIATGAFTLLLGCVWDCISSDAVKPLPATFFMVCCIAVMGIGTYLSWSYRVRINERLAKIRSESRIRGE